ncbi:MAG: chemotaxis protein CheA [Deltaproteobacteria bacterium HGW-Deltaproteobacteria-23]|nr:MAG: chemotaxis protein CheA [Deltaproteobacteria bacterium HGW-Deltaproteobacteria-23]
MDGMLDVSVLLDEYLEDANGHVDAVEVSLMELEKRWTGGVFDENLLTLLLGSLHTLKGNSGMMGFTSVQQYVHKLESALKNLQEGIVPVSSAVFEGLYTAVSALRSNFSRLAANHKAPIEFSDEMSALELLFFNKDSVPESLPSGNQPQAQLNARGTDVSYITQKSSTLKVSFEKLDELLNLVGELVIHRTALNTLEKRLQEKITDRVLLEAFSEASQLIGKSSADLREAIMKARMLPIKSVFQRFQRLVRDNSHKSGKEIHLKFEGEETELDKTVIDEIGEPLLHLIRNAVDHGVESKDERRRAGKSPAGTITLKACHESNHIVIAVEDDGCGMDAEKIRRSAAAKGLISLEEAQGLSEQESLQLLFLPGFSTSSKVTETSGRGIGLDVVKKIVTSLNGMIEISGKPEKGSRFTIKLPLTLAIITALMVDVADETFAIPLSGVLESIRVQSSEIHEVGGSEVINLRERLLPIHRLDSFFWHKNSDSRDYEYIVVVGSGDKRGGLVVDRLIGQQEIVIKALDDYLGDLPGISGGTVLGDGNISMIVDIGSILSGGKS